MRRLQVQIEGSKDRVSLFLNPLDIIVKKQDQQHEKIREQISQKI
jgi:hypothetical protein